VKAVIGETLYNVIERKVKRKLPTRDDQGNLVLDDDKRPVLTMQETTRTQLVSIGRNAQRIAEANLGITSSRQRRRHRTSQVRNASVTWLL
jgi:hypothetical protein